MLLVILSRTSALGIQDSLLLQGKCSTRHVFMDSMLDSIAHLSNGQAMAARSRLPLSMQSQILTTQCAMWGSLSLQQCMSCTHGPLA